MLMTTDPNNFITKYVKCYQMKIQRQISRRNFIERGSLGLLGMAVPINWIPGSHWEKWRPGKLSVQLYTVREQMKTDIPATLKRIRDIGFEHVETAFWPAGVTLDQAARYLNNAGLSVSSAHIEIPLGDKKQVMLDTAAAFHCKKMIWHGWPEDKRYSSLEGTMELAGIYNESAKFAKSNGLQFGLHNHWWEYRNKVGGRLVYEVLLENLDTDIFFEVDAYWVKVAGQDPAAIVKKLGSRAECIHIKDGPARWSDSLPLDNPDPMTAVGKGVQNFPAIVRAADGNTEWMVVEMDKTATDVFVALKESYDYLISHQLARVS
jgi:sugar phosphate isomerase/epimerase